MNTVDHGEGLKTKFIAWKAKMDDFLQKVVIRGPKESEEVLRKNQDLKMPTSEMSSRIERFNGGRPTEWAPLTKNIDNGLGDDMRGKYVLRPRISWTGLYGKEPWPRERKQWEKV
jgi:hypothetical protein